MISAKKNGFDHRRLINQSCRLSRFARSTGRAVLCFHIAAASLALPAPNQLFYESRPAMGTSFEVYLYAPNRERASQLFEAAFDEIERVEAALSNYRSSSELSRINASAADARVMTDPASFALLGQALADSRESDGAFNCTVGK